jgi:peroxiredoxin Q/BCP
MKRKRLYVLTAALAVAAFGAVGGAMAAELEVGDVAPPFELPGSDGNTHTLAQYEGRTVVLAWFLKAFTGG